MMPERRHARPLGQYGNAAAALLASILVLGLLGAGLKTLPALGPALVPGHGAWESAAGGKLPAAQTLSLPGLSAPAQVAFSTQGIATVSAATDTDAYLALGYVHASFRLTQLDLERRIAAGRLAQLAGPAGVASDKFELRLGLTRIAQQEWAAMPKSSPAARALVAYSRGINDYLAQVRASGHWPAVYALAGVYPANWTPVDSLLVQGALTQQLDFSTAPLDYAVLARSLGPQQTSQWFPVLPPGNQNPWDRGPYKSLGTAALTSARVPGPAAAVPAGTATAAGTILAQTAALPAGQIHTAPDSNAWAANGPKVANGGAMLAGDPHLLQTLPSIWYEVALRAPGLQVSGVSVPGMPGVLIGHNAHIAWSITNAQNQSALFYAEQTSSSRPGEYFWRGQWREMQVLHYQIPVRGGSTQQLTVDQTVHGPILTQAGQTVSVDWMGALGSPDLADMLALDRAANWPQFRSALATWRSPTLSFVYADDRGNIGAIAPGYYPLVRRGDPRLPMPGTGADDVAGVIPYAAVPQVYDPPAHIIAAANQRPVTGAYPYYVGTSGNFYDPGYRADTEYQFLRNRSGMRAADFAELQDDLTDQLAAVIVPKLTAALKQASLTPTQQLVEAYLAGWNTQMAPTSISAVVWWRFWSDYLSAVFQPWWNAAKVPVHLDRGGLAVGPGQASLDEDLETWTLHDQANPAFSPPGGPRRTAQQVLREAFAKTVASLTKTLGSDPTTWTWGSVHTRQFPSILGSAALGYGPRGAGGDPWTVDAAEGGLGSQIGPGWRMIVGWKGPGKPDAEAIYAGGQSENPASPWYENLVSQWWNGKYLPMPWPASPARPAATISWELRP
jgi:penicillin amidase